MIPPARDGALGSVASMLSADRDVGPTGLTSAVAAERFVSFGPNELPAKREVSDAQRFLAQFANPIVITLLVALVVATVDGSHRPNASFLVRYGDALSIALIVLLNAALGFVQERRAEIALRALEKMQTPTARVRRDGVRHEIPAREVVVGDVVLLDAGDAVPADAELIKAIDLFVEESALTGESGLVTKTARASSAAPASRASLSEREDRVFLGTSIVNGAGVGVVVATGARTELGRVNTLVRDTVKDAAPIEADLARFGQRVLWGCLALSLLLFVRGVVAGGRSWNELFLEAVSVAVAAIPEGLPAITTITLALGLQRMAKKGAIVRSLSAVETLGAATVICTDKTGTLTENAMTVTEVYAGSMAFAVSGVGYAPDGEVTVRNDVGAASDVEPLRRLLHACLDCNNADIKVDALGRYVPLGDPSEAALVTLARKKIGRVVTAEPILPRRRVAEFPFDGERRLMTVVVERSGRTLALTKGAADSILPRVTHVRISGGIRLIDEELRRDLHAISDDMSDRSLRVFAVAARELDGPWNETGAVSMTASTLESDLTFLGFVGMKDPPRRGVLDAIRACHAASVNVIMITGDHKKTAVAIAKELSLWTPGSEALSGDELRGMSSDAFAVARRRVRVFARVTAEQKLQIVRALKSDGQVVAMTGDGVNDAPALREAHIGIAMGRGGTDVAREASDMVLVDDNFETIVEAIREGRAIYRNIQKFIFFLLSSNAGLVIVVFAASFFGRLPPLTPLMILWINLVTNGLPALGLGVDPPLSSQMHEPPRRPRQAVLSLRDYIGMLFVGGVMGACAMAVYLVPSDSGGSSHGLRSRALTFSILAISPLFHAWSCRSRDASIFSLRPLVATPLLVTVLISLAIHLVSVLIPDLRLVFRTFPVTPHEWLLVFGLSAAVVPAVEIAKWVERRTRRPLRERGQSGTLPPDSSR